MTERRTRIALTLAASTPALAGCGDPPSTGLHWLDAQRDRVEGPEELRSSRVLGVGPRVDGGAIDACNIEVGGLSVYAPR